MKIKYDKVTDSLYIDLNRGVYEKSRKITESVVVDVSKEGKVLGIEILEASRTIAQFDPTNPKSVSISSA